VATEQLLGASGSNSFDGSLLASPRCEAPSDTAAPDPTLSRLISAGNEPRQPDFARQIEDEIPFLRRTVRRWQREKSDADDLVQDTLVRALANSHLWQPGSDLRGWLFAIMRNQFLAGIGKSNRLAAVLRSFAEADRSRAPDPGEARLVLRDVEEALKRLPSKQRTAVLLAGVDGKSYDEVAQAMGLSVGAVRSHLARGRDRLRAATHGSEDASPFAPRPGSVPAPAAAPAPFPVIPPSMAHAEAD
jgi:RNA polymerase sigma factor (sigma-70 family)